MKIKNIEEKISSKKLKIGIIGLGYVGLPLAMTYNKKGFQVFGYDIDIKKINQLLNKKNYILDVEDEILVNYEEKKYHHNVYLIKWNNDRIWRFSVLTSPNLINKYKEETLNIVESFDSLTNYDKKIAQPLRIEIIKVLDTDTIYSLSEKMAVLKNKKELFCVMNGLDCNSENTLITSGALIKMISY